MKPIAAALRSEHAPSGHMDRADANQPDPFGALELNLDGYILDTPEKRATPLDWGGPDEGEQAFEYEEPEPPPHAAQSQELPRIDMSDAGHSHRATATRPPQSESRSLGVWRLDKKRKKR